MTPRVLLGTDPGIVTALEVSLQSIFASAPPPDTLWLLPGHPLYAQAIAAAEADAQEPGAV